MGQQTVTDVAFPEFTAGLINSTFDALVSANIRQMEAYTELTSVLSQKLSEYINNTRDEVSGQEILQFLERVLPLNSDEHTTKVVKGQNMQLSAADAESLNKALELPAAAGKTPVKVTAGKVDDQYTKILDSVADKIVVNKYLLLNEMVKQGMLRLVIENGTIETRLNFSAWSYDHYSNRSTGYSREETKSGSKKSRGLFGTLFFGPSSGKSNKTSIHVNTSNATSGGSEGSRYNIFGGVRLNFKTDYLPLAD
ncbi:hypothetical protein [Prosthecochloris sp. HL-130-GSB]|uniref:hypothetical protein n=1 Tax=Prosthecochloris sp. HL-130-GSB TaxID=1974213 RepID=UPI000A1C0D96|nr:hypothetical protein [Prosthecochloris sp. HL-130-GSB]ARM31075.1 hypothetical protein B9H02_06895 [Prosthecochloris sp. HL-130-GSB]MBO8092111.1 hypothetical protein [Prosthecochloris sp.]